MRIVLCLMVITQCLLMPNLVNGQIPRGPGIQPAPAPQYLGKFKLGPDGKLAPIQSPLGVDPDPFWFETTTNGEWYFNAGPTSTTSANNEFVSHGQGIEAGGTITGFRLYWVAGQDAVTTDIDILASFYDGRDLTNTPKVPIAQFLVGFTLPAGLSGWFADIELDAEDYFVMPSLDFEYGLQFFPTGGPAGPFLHEFITGQTFGMEADAAVGKTYCVFERWNPFGQYDTVSGAHNGGPFWFGNDPGEPPTIPAAPWAAAEFHMTYIPSTEVSVVSAGVYHDAYTGAGSKLDSGKVVHIEGETTTALTYDNLINSAGGLRGVLVEFAGVDVGTLDLGDFEFRMSPQGVFATAPGDWALAPAPTLTTGTIGGFEGSPDHALLTWSAGSLTNRWLRIVTPDGTVLYIGHLLGETTGPSGSTYTVAFADITPIRAAVGNTVNSSSVHDLDKNGTVAFADISAMTSNIGTQLSNISVP